MPYEKPQREFTGQLLRYTNVLKCRRMNNPRFGTGFLFEGKLTDKKDSSKAVRFHDRVITN
jgi:hypothetical protein